jgi:hypothetical protein
MGPSNRVKITAYLVSGAWSLALLIDGVKLPNTVDKVLGFLPVMIVLLFAAFDNWLWRLGPVKGFVKRPDLNGTWQGTLTSIRPDSTGQEITYAPIPIFLVIRETYLTLSITLISEQSKSRSIAGMVQVNDTDDFTVYYHYTNTPDLPHRPTSPIHSGGAKLEIAGVAPLSLDGEYWTDRRTRGIFKVSRASKKRYGTYADATAELAGGGN